MEEMKQVVIKVAYLKIDLSQVEGPAYIAYEPKKQYSYLAYATSVDGVTEDLVGRVIRVPVGKTNTLRNAIVLDTITEDIDDYLASLGYNLKEVF